MGEEAELGELERELEQEQELAGLEQQELRIIDQHLLVFFLQPSFFFL